MSPIRSLFGLAGGALLLTAVSADATLFTVGSGGTHSEIRAAIADALSTAGNHEVRVQAGNYAESLFYSSPVAATSVSITGGWNAGFTERDPDPARTVVDNGGNFTVISLLLDAGTTTVNGFTFTGADESIFGGGRLRAYGSGSITFSNNRVIGNRGESTIAGNSVSAGGLVASADGDGQMRVINNLISDNVAESIEGSGNSGGLQTFCSDNALMIVKANRIEDNTILAETTIQTGGLFFSSTGRCSARFEDNVIRDNLVLDGNTAFATGALLLSLPDGGSPVDNVLRFERNLVQGNDALGTLVSQQVSVIGNANSLIRMTNTVISDSLSAGLRVTTGLAHLHNLTIANHDGPGLTVVGATPVVLANSILVANGPSDFGDAMVSNNLIDADPRFRDPAAGNYRLRSDSAAIDAGNNTPVGGLAANDAEGQDSPRVVNGVVDIGAYEAPFTTPAQPGYGFKVTLVNSSGTVSGVREPACIGETVCVSGALAGRSEMFLRLIGPRPNGFFWTQLVRFTPSAVDVSIEQLATGEIQTYNLPALPPSDDRLSGLVDRMAFLPVGSDPRSRSARGQPTRFDLPVDSNRPRELVAAGVLDSTLTPIRPFGGSQPRMGTFFTSPEFPDHRFAIQITNNSGTFDATPENRCISETICASGAVPGRSELFVRLIGPRPNGFLWAQLVRFTPSKVDVWIEKISTGDTNHYVLPALPPDDDALAGFVDKEAFLP